LTWIIRSEGTRFVGDSIRSYGPGDLVLLGPDLPHCWHDEPASRGSGAPEVVVVQFRADCFGGDFLALDAARAVGALFRRASRGVRFSAPTAREVGPELLGMTRQRGLRRMAGLLDILAILSAAGGVSLLASQDYQLNNDINPANRRRIELVHRFVRERMREEISQADIARRLGLSPPAFSRFFRSATGKTFVGFVNALRVNEACRLLSGTIQPVTEIALACGYQNLSNFNRQFLALRGMNPSEYRRQLRRREGRAASLLALSAVPRAEATGIPARRRAAGGRP
jgi:AraC-like DNA-binding protein